MTAGIHQDLPPIDITAFRTLHTSLTEQIESASADIKPLSTDPEAARRLLNLIAQHGSFLEEKARLKTVLKERVDAATDLASYSTHRNLQKELKQRTQTVNKLFIEFSTLFKQSAPHLAPPVYD